MSVLIKKMEMPKHCGECSLLDWVSGECLASTVRDNNYFKPTLRVDGFMLDANGNKIRHKDCPLVEVPPHGRLIDADEYEHLLQGLGNRDYRRGKGTIQDAVKFLQEHYTPTVIESEE